jgi:HSP20 family protein
METIMADVPVEVKKAPSAEPAVPDVWGSFRSEMDRLFDRFASGFGFPSLRRMFETEPWRPISTFRFSVPAIDMSEDDKAYKNLGRAAGSGCQGRRRIDLRRHARPQRREASGEGGKGKELLFLGARLGSFQRAFELPASIDRDKVSADFAKGVLTITLPKTPEAQKQQKKIEVKSA